MLWIFFIAVVMSTIDMGHCADGANLTEITWCHAVNSQKLLKDALKSDVKAIEADVIIGIHETNAQSINNDDGIPIMGHPPAVKSDLSLVEFLTAIKEYHSKPENVNKTKIVKLDFKSIEATERSIEMLEKDWKKFTFPIWVNADILDGPGGTATPVDARRFIVAAKKLEKVTLSIGWTTGWHPGSTASYTHDHANEMIKAIEGNSINGSGHPITFPIRAIFAVSSGDTLRHLYEHVTKSNDETTLTIWTGASDTVNPKELEKFIKSFGVDKVYLDVPDELRNGMNLG